MSAAGGEFKDVEQLVYDRFMQYSGFGDKSKAGEIDNNMFAKLAKECQLVNKSCTKTDVDLVFARVKPKGGRKLNYTQFQQALLYLSEKRAPKTFKEQGPQAAQMKLMELIAASSGPVAHATAADNVRLHDDKSTYTGVYAKGGPTNVDNKITLSNLADRSNADARGVKM